MMRAGIHALIALVILGGCVDFGLESRRFRCSADPAICGEGWTCGADGFCTREQHVPMDAAAIDGMMLREICGNGEDDDENGRTDCQDETCGEASCDDQNACTTDTCQSSGMCARSPREGSCGTGCTCEPAGMPTEVACGDIADNDDDTMVDCNDDDCPGCLGGLTCCSDGSCRTTCG